MMFTPILVFGQDQVYFSETWTQDGGESALFYKNSSATDNIGNVYMAGSAINLNNNHDIIIQKFDPDGGLLWEEIFNGAANLDDFAADIFVDDNYDVFITGSSVKLAANDQDLVVLKYNSSGVFQWYSYYDNGGSPTPKDFGTSIIGDNNGSVYVTGGSFGATSNSDFITLGIASNNGTQLWEKRADFSAYGPNIDLLAPGVENAIYTLSNTGSLNSGNNLYRTFSGTSAAAPHTSGVAALMLSLHNPDYNPTYPNHLGQEDVEYILKNTAKPILNDPDHPNNSPNLPVPNQYSGNGLLNAYESLMHSSLPYRVHHFDFKVNKDAGIIYVSNQNVEFPEGIDGIPSGSQILQTTVYEVTYTFTHNLPLNEIFIDGWIRNASSDLYSLEDTLFNSHWSGVKIDAIDESIATLTGYYYITEVLTNGNTSIVISPEPDNNNDFKFAYSVYTKDTSYHLNVDENNPITEEITVYPNPTNNLVNIRFSNKTHDLNIYDIRGREIKNFNIENSSDKSLKVDISTLPQGMYLFIFNKGGSTITKKIIKQ